MYPRDVHQIVRDLEEKDNSKLIKYVGGEKLVNDAVEGEGKE